MKKNEIVLLLTLAMVQFTHILDSMIMMPMAPVIRNSFSISTQQFGFLVSSYGLSAFVSAISATFWIDRFDRKKVLTFLYIGFLAGTLACALSPDYSFFIIARIFTGLFGGIAGAVILSIVGDCIPVERRAHAMGILMSGFAMASVIGVPLGIWLSEKFSWHSPFLFICIIGAPVLAAVFFLIPNVNSHIDSSQKKSPFVLYQRVFSSSNMRTALLLSMFVVFAHFAIIPYISDYFVHNLNFRMADQLILMYVIGGLLSTISSPFIGKIADRKGRYKVFFFLSVLAIFPIFMISNFNSHSLPFLLFTTSLFFIFSGGRMIPTQALVTSAVEPSIRGGFMSLNSATQQLSIGLCSLLGGTIIKNDELKHLVNYNIVGMIGILFTVLAIFAGFKLKAVTSPLQKK